MEDTTSSSSNINYSIFHLTGLSDISDSKYSKAGLVTVLFQESLKKLGEDTIPLVQVKELKWSPAKWHQETIDGKPMAFSGLDTEMTLKLQTEYIPQKQTGRGAETSLSPKSKQKPTMKPAIAAMI
jgi:hypothetical protein